MEGGTVQQRLSYSKCQWTVQVQVSPTTENWDNEQHDEFEAVEMS